MFSIIWATPGPHGHNFGAFRRAAVEKQIQEYGAKHFPLQFERRVSRIVEDVVLDVSMDKICTGALGYVRVGGLQQCWLAAFVCGLANAVLGWPGDGDLLHEILARNQVDGLLVGVHFRRFAYE